MRACEVQEGDDTSIVGSKVGMSGRIEETEQKSYR